MAFNLRIREIGDCYAGSRSLLRLELRQSRVGAWEIEVVDREQDRRITSQYDDEPAARRAAEIAYAYGRQFGQWRVQRAEDYHPEGGSVIGVGWEPEPVPAKAPAAG